jgi:hypothetical protein
VERAQAWEAVPNPKPVLTTILRRLRPCWRKVQLKAPLHGTFRVAVHLTQSNFRGVIHSEGQVMTTGILERLVQIPAGLVRGRRPGLL